MIFGYVRVSSRNQVDGSSPEEQEKRCRAIADLRGADRFDFVCYRDLGVSGSVPLGERPGGKALLEAAQKGDVLVAVKLDRMFRSTIDALQMLQVLKQRGVDVILTDLGSEPITGEGVGKLVFGLMAMFADYERERIGARTKEGREAKREAGGHLGGVAPYGYRVEGEGKQAKLVPLDAEQDIVRQVRDLSVRFAPSSVVRIARDRNLVGRNGKPLGFMQIKRIAERRHAN